MWEFGLKATSKMILIFILKSIMVFFHKEILIDFVKGAIITLVNKVMVSLVSLLTFNVIPLSLTLVGTWQLRHSNKEGGKTTKIVFCKKKLPKNPKNLLRLPYPKATFIVFLGFPCYQTINFDDCLKSTFFAQL